MEDAFSFHQWVSERMEESSPTESPAVSAYALATVSLLCNKGKGREDRKRGNLLVGEVVSDEREKVDTPLPKSNATEEMEQLFFRNFGLPPWVHAFPTRRKFQRHASRDHVMQDLKKTIMWLSFSSQQLTDSLHRLSPRTSSSTLSAPVSIASEATVLRCGQHEKGERWWWWRVASARQNGVRRMNPVAVHSTTMLSQRVVMLAKRYGEKVFVCSRVPHMKYLCNDVVMDPSWTFRFLDILLRCHPLLPRRWLSMLVSLLIEVI